MGFNFLSSTFFSLTGQFYKQNFYNKLGRALLTIFVTLFFVTFCFSGCGSANPTATSITNLPSLNQTPTIGTITKSDLTTPFAQGALSSSPNTSVNPNQTTAPGSENTSSGLNPLIFTPTVESLNATPEITRSTGQSEGPLASNGPTQTTTPDSSQTAVPSATIRANAPGEQGSKAIPGLVSIPYRLVIPKISVSAYVEKIGILNDGTLGIPTDANDVAWWRDGPKPGSEGNAVIDGHLDWTSGPAVFWNLNKLGPGDIVKVYDANNQYRQFIVTELASYPYNDAPLMRIFGPISGAHLNLITCQGTYSHSQHNYDRRLVVYTTEQ